MNKIKWKKIEAEASRRTVLVLFVGCVGGGVGDDWMHEQNLRLASVTTNIETGQLVIIKRCLCPVAFCNYKCLHIGSFPNSALFYTFI